MYRQESSICTFFLSYFQVSFLLDEIESQHVVVLVKTCLLLQLRGGPIVLIVERSWCWKPGKEEIFRKNYAVSVIGKVPRGRMISPPGIISDVNNYNFLCTLTVYTTEDLVQFEGISETGKYLLTRESKGIEKLKSDLFS